MKSLEDIAKQVLEMNVNKGTVAEVHKVSEKKYPYAVVLNFNDYNVYNSKNQHMLVSGMDMETAEELASLINNSLSIAI